jgi:PE-PPE domain-containing protein
LGLVSSRKGESVGKSPGRHRVKRTPKVVPVAGAAGVAAAASAVALGLTPSLTVNPLLAATVHYLRGTDIGTDPGEPAYLNFIDEMTAGTGVDPNGDDTKSKVIYPASFWPVSSGGLNDDTYDVSVGKGLNALEAEDFAPGDVIFGYSQGAVVASEYKAAHPDQDDVTYVLVENPNRPNGGILERFNGLSIPVLGVTFNGATPDTGATTYDISRQYDGWSDFPAYPLNFLADANAIAGIYYLHGATQTEITADDLDKAEEAGGIYYQDDGSTKYYLIKTERLPLLMPFDGIVPDPILDAVDPPLRVLVELGYDRSDYGTPTTAGLVPTVNPITVATDLANATVTGVQTGLQESNISTPNLLTNDSIQAKGVASPTISTPTIKPPDLGSGTVLDNLTNVLPKSKTTPTVKPQTPQIKLPTLTSKPSKPSVTSNPTSSAAKPLSPKHLAESVSHALGIKKDKPSGESGN